MLYTKYISCPDCSGIGGYVNCPGCLGSGFKKIDLENSPDIDALPIDQEVRAIKNRIKLIINNNQWNPAIENQVELDYKKLMGKLSTPEIDVLLESIQLIRSNNFRKKLTTIILPKIIKIQPNQISLKSGKYFFSGKLFSSGPLGIKIEMNTKQHNYFFSSKEFSTLLNNYISSATIILHRNILQLNTNKIEENINNFISEDFHNIIVSELNRNDQYIIKKDTFWRTTEAYRVALTKNR